MVRRDAALILRGSVTRVHRRARGGWQAPVIMARMRVAAAVRISVAALAFATAGAFAPSPLASARPAKVCVRAGACAL